MKVKTKPDRTSRNRSMPFLPGVGIDTNTARICILDLARTHGRALLCSNLRSDRMVLARSNYNNILNRALLGGDPEME